MKPKIDFGSTTAVNIIWEKVKERVSPKAFWGGVCALVFAVGFVMNLRHNVSNALDDVERLKLRLDEVKASLASESAALTAEREKSAEMGRHIEDLGTEVDRLREWRDHVQGVAETSPHARRRH